MPSGYSLNVLHYLLFFEIKLRLNYNFKKCNQFLKNGIQNLNIIL